MTSVAGMTLTPTVVSFDLDDTLWPIGPVMVAAERTLLAWLDAEHPQVMRGRDVGYLRRLRAAVADEFPERAHDMTFLRHHTMKRLFEPGADAHRHADAALEVFLAERNRVTCYDDVFSTLKRLRTKYRLFALSNGNADLDRCGIAGLFDGHVTAIAAGAAKPDARIFAHLVRLAGVEAGEVLHVGDDPQCDVVGAMQAGMQAAWLNRDAKPWPAELGPPPRTISTLAEIF
jgi:HAD superfamily hydrolase (TIGR01509 family)